MKSSFFRLLLPFIILFFLPFEQLSSQILPPEQLEEDCLFLRLQLWDTIDNGASLADFESVARELLNQARTQKCKQQFLLTWASTYAVDFASPEASRNFIDSLLSKSTIEWHNPYHQTLLVQQASNYSDLDVVSPAKVLTDSFSALLKRDDLVLIDTNYYFMLSSVFGELEQPALAASLLNDLSVRFSGDRILSWQVRYHLMLNAAEVEDYPAASRHFRLSLPLTDTSALNSMALAELYGIGAYSLLQSGDTTAAKRWNTTAESVLDKSSQPIMLGYYLMVEFATATGITEQVATAKQLISFARSKTPPAYIRRLAYAKLYSNTISTKKTLPGKAEIYQEWKKLIKKTPPKQASERLAFAAATVAEGYVTAEGQEAYKQLLASYRDEANKEGQRVNAEMANKYERRIQQDSIALLMLQSEASKTEANASRERQRLLLLTLGVVLAALFLLLLAFRRRKALNKELAQKNARITLLNIDINHRTSGYLGNIIKLLKEQKFKLDDAGADPHVLDELERQTLVYTKLQHLHTTVDDRMVINLKQYLEKLTNLLLKSFQCGEVPILLDLKAADINVDPKLALPLALILNELMTNTAKYAARKEGVAPASFRAELADAQTLVLNYEDDGPSNDSNTSAHFSSNTGLDLITGLTKQMAAKMEQVAGYGYRARVEL